MLSPFVQEQVNALLQLGIQFDYFAIRGNGYLGYIKSSIALFKAIKTIKPDLVHAHFGLSGCVAIFQRRVPVITTFHGTDITYWKNRIFSFIAYHFSWKAIFVSEKLAKYFRVRKPLVIPCGIDLDLFKSQKILKEDIGLDPKKRYVLFSSSANIGIKNFKLARESVELLNDNSIELIELKGYSRKEVSQLMNAVDVGLMTSLKEGSPQFIKEALACNLPIVTVDVGTVKELLSGAQGSFITDYKSSSIASALKEVLKTNQRANSHSAVSDLDNKLIASRVFEIYKLVKK